MSFLITALMFIIYVIFAICRGIQLKRSIIDIAVLILSFVALILSTISIGNVARAVSEHNIPISYIYGEYGSVIALLALLVLFVLCLVSGLKLIMPSK